MEILQTAAASSNMNSLSELIAVIAPALVLAKGKKKHLNKAQRKMQRKMRWQLLKQLLFNDKKKGKGLAIFVVLLFLALIILSIVYLGFWLTLGWVVILLAISLNNVVFV